MNVTRFLYASQDHPTGKLVLRFRDEHGRLVALRMRPQQFRTLANGVLGLAQALEAQS